VPDTALVVRSLESADLPAALAIQSLAYPAFLREDEAAFESRLTVASSFCFAATRGGSLVGYLLAHGWARTAPPPVGTVLPADAPAQVLFVHDLAVSPVGRGGGAGRLLAARAFDAAGRAGLAEAELVAVEGAAAYWRSLGFVAPPVSAALAAKVAGYGPAACWMTRRLDGPRPSD